MRIEIREGTHTRKLTSQFWLLKEQFKSTPIKAALYKQKPLGWLSADPKKITCGIPKKTASIEYKGHRHDVNMKKPFVFLGAFSSASLVDFSELTTTKFVYDVLSGVNIKDTSLYRHINTGGEIGRSFGKIRDVNDIKGYADYVLRIAEWVEWKKNASAGGVLDLGSIYCSVSRDNVCFLKNGNHRLAIAKYLGAGKLRMEIYAMSFNMYYYGAPYED